MHSSRYEITKELIDCEIALVDDQELHINPEYHAALIEKLNNLMDEIIEKYGGAFVISSSLGSATHNVEISIEVKVEES